MKTLLIKCIKIIKIISSFLILTGLATIITSIILNILNLFNQTNSIIYFILLYTIISVGLIFCWIVIIPQGCVFE
jgi:hypothetical protein